MGKRAVNESLRQKGERYLNTLWYDSSGQTRSNAILTLFSGIYGAAVRRRLNQRQLGMRDSTICFPNKNRKARPLVVVVGNITVGGTGKTPLIIALAKALKQQGLSLAVISRGYGGTHTKSNEEAHVVTKADPASLVGDEPALMCRQLDVPLVIARKRNNAIELIDQSYAVDLILSDDGMQHYSMVRDMEVLVVDAQRGLGNKRLLPAGPLREPLERIAQVDMIVVNGEPDKKLLETLESYEVPMSQVLMQSASFRPINPRAIQQAGGEDSVEILPVKPGGNDKIYLVAGIGNPEKFFEQTRKLLLQQGIKLSDSIVNTDHYRDSEQEPTQLIEIALDDHHEYREGELQKQMAVHSGNDSTPDFSRELVLVTEKDAVKLVDIASDLPFPVYAVGLEVRPDAELVTSIVERHKNFHECQGRLKD